ncbi:uncharacterized protein LOC106176819 [Lingula anatina]|uniref:Uncharacterized protein LOC106175056 n=1 Tax=Lingula anatina TaxID=7574 RepID=A0A1S3JQ98_LINAN|nr:uncharacterized protein LOC106175056 [Lingula anatina]XP_013414806.1 uncharacterized protein LOC106176819 [Lingula anatina]|eukprot:XP_013412326.1 uncharacterized protein LOC106175056 [Lingula anatina]
MMKLVVLAVVICAAAATSYKGGDRYYGDYAPRSGYGYGGYARRGYNYGYVPKARGRPEDYISSCNGKAFSTTYEDCCGGVVYDRRHQDCCDGYLVINKPDQCPSLKNYGYAHDASYNSYNAYNSYDASYSGHNAKVY